MKQYWLNRNRFINVRLFNAVLALPCLFVLSAPGNSAAEIVTHSANHVFSIDNVQGDFEGGTYAQDPSIICGITDSCPGEAQPFDDSGTMLYPVDSRFGFYVEDFVGAAQKERDGDYAEGWVGNVVSNGIIEGITVSNAKTDTFKVKAPMGTWCAGLGGNKVKCSTEHFTVVEHIKTCYETIPYMHADPDTGVQSPLYYPGTEIPIPILDPDTGEVIGDATCAEGVLDNNLLLVENGQITDTPLEIGEDGFPIIPANESDVRNDIAVGRDYSITKKDDGKPLYRFGSMVKRPNDVRMYARLPLPQEWKDNPETNFPVVRAELHIEHLITNNPNDQVRPEDMENEGATGRLPGYTVIGDVWYSNENCYEGDGDYIPANTVFKNPSFADTLGEEETDPLPFSEDLKEGFTNAWYTTTDRDPFVDYYVGDNYISGPRWRLKPNKFGQDLPGLEVPSVNCLPTPYTSQFIKYNVGELTTTVLDLLDFEDDNSPLLGSHGWIMPNGVNEVALNEDGTEKVDAAGNPISVNGIPLTEDFDLAVYVKGDRKPVAIYNATLVIEYEGEGTDPPPPPPEGDFDLSLDSIMAPLKAYVGATRTMAVYVTNNGPEVAGGILELKATLASDGTLTDTWTADISAVQPGETVKFVFTWLVPEYDREYVNWTGTIIAESDLDITNNDATAVTYIRYR